MEIPECIMGLDFDLQQRLKRKQPYLVRIARPGKRGAIGRGYTLKEAAKAAIARRAELELNDLLLVP